MHIYLRVILLLTLTAPTVSSFGQTCCSGGVPMSGNLGLPSDSKGTLQLSLSHDVNILRTLKFENELLDDNSRERITNSTILEIGYTITNRISVDFLGSVVQQSRTIFSPVESSSETSGIGDAILLLKYRLTRIESPRTIVFGLGSKLSTGKTDYRNEQGILYSADLQPGSGAIDQVLWASFSQQFPFRKSMSLSITPVYRFTGKNNSYLGSETYEFGDEFQALLSLSDRVNIGRILLDPAISFRYRFASEDKINSSVLPNSGGNWVFLVPSVAFPINQSFSLASALDLPVYSRPDGTQLSPSLRLNISLFLRLNRSEKTDIIDL